MTATVLSLPTTRRAFGARSPVVRREDFTAPRGGACGDRALHLIDLAHISARFSRLIIASADRTFTETTDEARRLGMTIRQVTGRGGRSRELDRGTDLRMRLRLPRSPAEVLAARARRLRSCWGDGTLATGARCPRATTPDELIPDDLDVVCSLPARDDSRRGAPPSAQPRSFRMMGRRLACRDAVGGAGDEHVT